MLLTLYIVLEDRVLQYLCEVGRAVVGTGLMNQTKSPFSVIDLLCVSKGPCFGIYRDI